MYFFRFFKSLLLSITLLTCLASSAQTAVTTNQTAEQLVHNLVGAGVVTMNPVLSCPSSASGIFKITNSNLGLKGGIILSTGFAASALGPASNLADLNNASRGDEDLTTLSGQPTYDACKLEFDFVPTGETVKFRYVFGSEEYPSFACTQYNDVFAFYISGPEYPTHKNIALIPGTNIPVAINTTAGVIGSSGGKLSICEAVGLGSPFKEYYVDNSKGTSIAYNGFTKVFTAVAAVTPCATYHLKLAIADAKDHQYDSGVFIEEGSLSSNVLSVSLNDNLLTPVPYCVRACKNGSFVFKRKYASSLPLTIHYLIQGTAVNGEDYKKIPDSVVIPAHDTMVTRTIVPVNMPATGPKTVKLFVYSPFSCGLGKSIVDTPQLAIYDSLYSVITTPDTLICNDRAVQLNVVGDRSFTYQWTPFAGLSDENIRNPVARPQTSTDYKLTTSFLTCPPVKRHVIISLPTGQLTLGSNTPCEGAALNLTSNKVAGATYRWKGPKGFSSNLQNPSIPDCSITDTGTYFLSISYSDCSVKGSVKVKIKKAPSLINQPKDVAVCTGDNATFSVTTSSADLIYQWQINTGSGFIDISNSDKYSGVYTSKLTITGVNTSMSGYAYKCIVSNSCSTPAISSTANLIVNDVPLISSQSPSQAICTGNSTSFSVSAIGNDIKYQWQISNGAEFSNIRNSSQYSGTITNTLVVTNPSEALNGYQFRCLMSGNCSPSVISKTDTLKIVQAPLINKQAANADVCAGDNAKFTISAIGNRLSYQWMLNTGNGFVDITDGALYSGIQTNKLIIAKTTEDMDAYQYRCSVSGTCQPGVFSNAAILNVSSRPRITSAPSGTSVCVGGHATFAVAAKGGHLTYQWFVNTGDGFTPLANNSVYNGALSNSLSVTHVTKSLSGYSYQCTILGTCEPSLTTNPVNLTVDSLPAISLQPSNHTVCAGDNVTLSVSAKGAQISYQWQLNTGSLFYDISDTGAFSGSTSNALNVHTSTDMNGYQYRCIITSVCARPVTSHIATLTVNTLPVITQQPSNATFCVGGNINFNLSVNGAGISYQWQADTGAGFVNLENKENYNGVTTNNLSVKNASALMNGYRYRCMLSNICSRNLASNIATLTVNTWPTVKSKGQILSVGNYKSYQWYYNNNPIQGATTPTYTPTKNGPYSVFVTDDNGCIDISPQYVVNNIGPDSAAIPSVDIKIYPNPATSIVHFEAPMKVNVSISNSHGKVVLHKDGAKTMDITKLPNGVYIINVYDEHKKLLKTDKLLKNSW